MAGGVASKSGREYYGTVLNPCQNGEVVNPSVMKTWLMCTGICSRRLVALTCPNATACALQAKVWDGSWLVARPMSKHQSSDHKPWMGCKWSPSSTAWRRKRELALANQRKSLLSALQKPIEPREEPRGGLREQNPRHCLKMSTKCLRDQSVKPFSSPTWTHKDHPGGASCPNFWQW